MADKMHLPKFWSSDHAKWNFGDAISVLIFRDLFFDFIPYRPSPWTVGSVLMEGAASLFKNRDNVTLPSYLDNENCEAVFWGCGLREPDSISPEFLQHAAILSVRGPNTASDLRAGAEMPMGDPGLFLAALYQPSPVSRVEGRSVCVPHYNDQRTDAEIARVSGCDLVLRPAIEPHLDALEQFLNVISSADFVLCGAMHAAIAAASYGRPFGFWDSGNVDIAYKWADLAALLKIECKFHSDLNGARSHYNTSIVKTIELPPLWPLICSAPAFVRPSGLLKVLRFEARRLSRDPIELLDEYIIELERHRSSSDRLAKLSKRLTDKVIPGLSTNVAELTASLADAKARLINSEAVYEAERTSLVVQIAEAERKLHDVINEHEQTRAALDVQISQMTVAHDANRAEAERKLSEISEQNASKLTALEKALETSVFEQRELQARLVNVLAVAEAEASKANSLEDEVAQIRLHWEESNSLAKAAQATLVDVSNELELARSDITSKSIELEAARLEASRMADKLDSVIAELEQSRAETSAKTTEIEMVRYEARSVADRLDATMTQFANGVNKIKSNKWTARALRLPIIKKFDAKISRQVEQIGEFLSRFDDSQLGMSSHGRNDRILAYLLKLTPSIPDMPLLDRALYRAMYPDVAATHIDPFTHYLEYGASEGRSPHPLLDNAYYAGCYPEIARFNLSALEHYIRFGAAKGYNPCELFDTSSYLKRYPDVKQVGCNPVLHYLRHPILQPHIHFDSWGYLASNEDVARAGINPLAHYLLCGRAEGRQPGLEASSAYQTPQGLAAGAEAVIIAEAIDDPASPAAEKTTSTEERPLVLMLDAFYPQPDQDSGSLDQVNFARIFKQLGYDVAFASMIDFDPKDQDMKPLSQLGVICVTGSEYRNVEEFVFLNGDRIAAFFLSRFNFGGAWIKRARAFCPNAQIIFNTVDLHHVREERQARLTGNMQAVAEAEMTKQQELACIEAADVSIVVSETERLMLDKLLPAADVRVVPLIREVKKREWPTFRERSGIAFVGGFRHQPNIDAVQFFLKDIWPKVLARSPRLNLYVIGSHMPELLSERKDTGVEWVGYVPELEPWLDKVCATIAPLRFGAGAKGKVVSSLLNGVPCVASSIACEGMGIQAGDGILAATDADDFVEAILEITTNEDLWIQTSNRGFSSISESYSLERGESLIEQIVPRAVAGIAK